MADWDVIAKQRLTEDWATLRVRLSSAQSGDAPHGRVPREGQRRLRRAAGGGARAARGHAQEPDRALQPAVAMGAPRGDPKPAGARDRRCAARPTTIPRALLRYLFALERAAVATCGRTRPPRRASSENLVVQGEPEFWFGCDCCAVGSLKPGRPRRSARPAARQGSAPGVGGRRAVRVDARRVRGLPRQRALLAAHHDRGSRRPRTSGLPVIDVPSDVLAAGQRAVRRPGRRAVRPARPQALDLS